MDSNALYIVVLALAAYLLYRRLTGVKKAPASVVLAKINAGALIVDVRSPEEFSGGAYRKAKNIPLQALPDRLGELGVKDGPIVLYCASGSRSSQAARILKKAGYSDVSDAGGLASMPR
jgi:phage shock protein E